jgi:hypothetical protein
MRHDDNVVWRLMIAVMWCDFDVTRKFMIAVMLYDVGVFRGWGC